MPQLPPAGAESVREGEGTTEPEAIVLQSWFVVVENGVRFFVRQSEAPLIQMLDRTPRVPAPVIDFTHIMKEGDNDDAVGFLEPGKASHDPIGFQGMLHKPARLCMMAPGASRKEIRRIQVTDDLLHPRPTRREQDFNIFLLVRHDLVWFLFL